MSATNKEIIYDAIVTMRDKQQLPTRKALLSILGIRRSIIDDTISTLINEGKIYAPERGVYFPLFEHPVGRVISKTPLACGMVKVDIGDEVWTLTPKEARDIGQCFMAEAMQYSNIELGHHIAQVSAMHDLVVKRLEAKIRALEK